MEFVLQQIQSRTLDISCCFSGEINNAVVLIFFRSNCFNMAMRRTSVPLSYTCFLQ